MGLKHPLQIGAGVGAVQRLLQPPCSVKEQQGYMRDAILVGQLPSIGDHLPAAYSFNLWWIGRCLGLRLGFRVASCVSRAKHLRFLYGLSALIKPLTRPLTKRRAENDGPPYIAGRFAVLEYGMSKDIKSNTPSRRRVLKATAATFATLGAAPVAFANTAPQLMRHASREIVLEFDVVPGHVQGVPASELNRT